MHRSVALKLYTLMECIEVNSIAEVGVWQGQASYFLHQFFPSAHLYLIDPWKPTEKYFKEGHPPSVIHEKYDAAFKNVQQLFQSSPRVTILRKTSLEALSDVPEGIDLAFIDGDHSYEAVKQDIQAWGKKVRHGGVLSGHDYHSNYPGVIQAVDECFGTNTRIGNVWATRVEK